MHYHLIVSRKNQANKKKLSLLTNHKNALKGMITSGVDCVNLFQQAEQGFDKLFGYNRQPIESFDFHNTLKNNSISEQLKLQEQDIKSGERKRENNQENSFSINLERKEANSQIFNVNTDIAIEQESNRTVSLFPHFSLLGTAYSQNSNFSEEKRRKRAL